MGKFTITENGTIQYHDGRGLKFINVLGLDDRFLDNYDDKFIIAEERFGMILCKRIRPEQEEKRSDQDFYDEANEANYLEKEMIGSFDKTFSEIKLVFLATITAFAVAEVVNFIVNLF